LQHTSQGASQNPIRKHCWEKSLDLPRASIPF